MNKEYTKIFPFIILLLGVAASAMVFLPALKYADLNTSYTGIQIVTGVKVLDLGPIADGKLPFNILALLAFALPLVAGLVSFISPRGSLFAIVLFIAAAVLLFLLPQMVHLDVTIFGGGITEYEVDWVLQTGAIVAGSLCIGGAVLSLLSSTIKA